MATTNDKSTTFRLPAIEFGAKVVVACPPGEEHDIAAVTVAYVRVRGCRVYYQGANVPVPSLRKLCCEVAPDLTILSLPSAPSEHKTTELIEALAQDVRPFSTILVGGNGALSLREHFTQLQIEGFEMAR